MRGMGDHHRGKRLHRPPKRKLEREADQRDLCVGLLRTFFLVVFRLLSLLSLPSKGCVLG